MCALRMKVADLFSVKYGALALLVLQNTFLVIFMRYSRTTSGPLYASSTAVFMMEFTKFVSCNLVVLVEAGSINSYLQLLSEELTFIEILKVSIPSLVYTIQNNLLYFALTHLDAATYQVCYQTKILTTAVFSVLLLNKKLSLLQWGSLLVLTIGVAFTQLSSSSNDQKANTTLGFLAVLVAAVLSGFAGVYFERILKNSKSSVWMRNIQMAFSSIALALGGVYFSDGAMVAEHGFFYGYNGIVVTVILLQAVGGLVVAVVVKYADNILKGFAASFSIVTSLILCYFFLDFQPTWMFFFGAVLVNVSMYLYSYSPPANQATLPLYSRREVATTV